MELVTLSLYLAFTAVAPLNPEHIWGRIGAIHRSEFLVEENFNADPHSAYKHNIRKIKITVDTRFENCERKDLKVGRTVDILGRQTARSGVQAIRIFVYEGNTPVRLARETKITAPDGSVRQTK